MAKGNVLYHGQSHPHLTGAMSPASMEFGRDRFAGGQDPCGYLAAFLPGLLFESNTFIPVGGPWDYTAGNWTVTTTGTGAAAAAATTVGGGVLLTCGSDSTFNTNLESKVIWTPVADKRIVAMARLQTSDITTVGFEFNLGSSAVDPANTNYTDVIGIKMAVGAGTMIGKVRGNSGTVANSATLYTATAATEFFVGFTAVLNATAANCDGGFFAGASLQSATYTPFTAAQQAQAAAILTSPPSMYCNLHAKGSAGNPTVLFTNAFMSIDR